MASADRASGAVNRALGRLWPRKPQTEDDKRLRDARKALRDVKVKRMPLDDVLDGVGDAAAVAHPAGRGGALLAFRFKVAVQQAVAEVEHKPLREYLALGAPPVTFRVSAHALQQRLHKRSCPYWRTYTGGMGISAKQMRCDDEGAGADPEKYNVLASDIVTRLDSTTFKLTIPLRKWVPISLTPELVLSVRPKPDEHCVRPLPSNRAQVDTEHDHELVCN